MKAHTVKAVRVAVLAISLCVACAAQADMYRWTDADGNTALSNQPPADTSQVKDLTKIEDAGDKRNDADADGRSTDSTTAAPQAPAPSLPVARTEPPPVRSIVPAATTAEPSAAKPAASSTTSPALARPVPSLTRPGSSADSVAPGPRPEAASSLRESGTAKRESESGPRASNRRVETEAVRDPCLTSPDPRCHERYRDHYHPYYGYAPSVTQTAIAPTIGANSTAGAGGSVGAQIRAAPPAALAPRRSDTVPTTASGMLPLR
jgi:hypothetical protein